MARAAGLTPWLIVLCASLAGCADAPPPAEPMVGGDPESGRLLLRQFGCGTCHRIPGVATASGDVGPPLHAIGRRVYLAGRLPNSSENMVRWIREPQSIDPRTTMPDLSVTEAHARDMTAYLRRLK